MTNFKKINEILKRGQRVSGLKQEVVGRSRLLAQVRATLPQAFADSILTAGLIQGRLTLGVASGAWGTRLRYSTERIRRQLAQDLQIDLEEIRIKVVHPDTGNGHA